MIQCKLDRDCSGEQSVVTHCTLDRDGSSQMWHTVC